VAENADVLIVGAGPAGLATAIAARLKGLSVTVADARRPPIEKACGEGLLPEGVAALSRLGIQLNSDVAFPIAGIRFCDEVSSASGKLPHGSASFGLRRTTLHALLLQRVWAARILISAGWSAPTGKNLQSENGQALDLAACALRDSDSVAISASLLGPILSKCIGASATKFM
jgi:flavin-dependent dehydrogenase